MHVLPTQTFGISTSLSAILSQTAMKPSLTGLGDSATTDLHVQAHDGIPRQ